MKFSTATSLSALVASLLAVQHVGASAIVCDHFCLPGETGCCIPPPTTPTPTPTPTLAEQDGVHCLHICLPGETGCCVPPATTTTTPALVDRACQHFCLPGETGCCIPPPETTPALEERDYTSGWW